MHVIQSTGAYISAESAFRILLDQGVSRGWSDEFNAPIVRHYYNTAVYGKVCVYIIVSCRRASDAHACLHAG
jgi:hypothetical protein